MDPHRFDQLARACAMSIPRRAVIRRLAAFAAGGALLTTLPSAARANHKAGHCTKPGKKCHKHKDCCDGLCSLGGVCVTRTQVDAWVVATVDQIDAFNQLATSAVDTIADMAEFGFSREIVTEVRTTAGAIGGIRTHLQTEVAPPAAADPLRALVEVFAAVADALSKYLQQIAEESYLETGDRATESIETALHDLPSIRVQIAALCETCLDA